MELRETLGSAAQVHDVTLKLQIREIRLQVQRRRLIDKEPENFEGWIIRKLEPPT
jgi:hypothetical protein